MLLSLAATAFLSGAAASSAVTSGDLPGLFVSACLDGSASIASATPIEFSALPSALRSRLGRPSDAKVWQLGVPGGGYLYSLTYTERGWGPKVCGVASQELSMQQASAAIETRLRGSTSGGSFRPMEWVDEKAGYRALTTRAGGFTVLQINSNNDSQAEAQAPR